MDNSQQLCLRWNNHHSTLVAVFDKLLENETFVDCTLAAEGKSLKAHKVVLSACSPYFESQLSKHYDKHPILILKDVKFQELKLLMNYMYRGEVNIPQDQLGALLKAAESLQVQGLLQNSNEETDAKAASIQSQASKATPSQTSLSIVQGISIGKRTRDDNREGSQSPGPRKNKKIMHKNDKLYNHGDAPNSSESYSNETAVENIPSLSSVSTKSIADMSEETVDTKSETRLQKFTEVPLQVPGIKEELEESVDIMVKTKSEYFDEMNEESIDDWKLYDDDDDDMSNMELIDDPKHPITSEIESIDFISAPSRLKYISIYEKFMNWRIENNKMTFSEDVLITYFKELALNLKPSSLWSIYSVLKRALSAKHNIDIKTYPELFAFLKNSRAGFQSKKIKVFTEDEIAKFLAYAPDDEYLVHKVALIFGIKGTCKREEICNLTMNDVAEYKNSMISVKLPSPNPGIERSFTVKDVFYEITKKYMSLRPSNAKTDRFFLKCQKGKSTQKPIGKNKIGGYPKVIANYLGLSDAELYTGHSFRQISPALMADIGRNLKILKCHDSLNSNDVEERYTEN